MSNVTATPTETPTKTDCAILVEKLKNEAKLLQTPTRLIVPNHQSHIIQGIPNFGIFAFNPAFVVRLCSEPFRFLKSSGLVGMLPSSATRSTHILKVFSAKWVVGK